jgi:hypothetical protein
VAAIAVNRVMRRWAPDHDDRPSRRGRRSRQTHHKLPPPGSLMSMRNPAACVFMPIFTVDPAGDGCVTPAPVPNKTSRPPRCHRAVRSSVANEGSQLLRFGRSCAVPGIATCPSFAARVAQWSLCKRGQMASTSSSKEHLGGGNLPSVR